MSYTLLEISQDSWSQEKGSKEETTKKNEKELKGRTTSSTRENLGKTHYGFFLNVMVLLFFCLFFPIYFYCWCCYRCSHSPHPLIHLHLSPASLPSGYCHTAVCIYELCIHVLWLITSTCFILSAISLPFWQLSVCFMCPCLCYDTIIS